MLSVRLVIALGALCAPSAITSLGRVRDVNTQRNQVTIVTNKAGEFGMGAKVYFYRAGKAKGSAQITQAFHTKAIARMTEGNPQIGDDVTNTAKAPKAGPKINRVSFAVTGAQSHEYIAEVQFDGQPKQQRKLVLNADVAAQIAGTTGFSGISATLIKKLEVVWQDGSLQVKKVYLSDRSSFDLDQIVATDLYAKIKPPAELRAQTLKGSVTLIKKVRDQPDLADRLAVALSVSARSERLKPGAVYKLKVYCNELFAGELLLKHDGQAKNEKLDLNPVDLAPGENSLEVRLVEVTEQGELYLETDNNQLIGMLATDKASSDRSTQVKVILADGQNAQVVQLK
jgi:hypothetical protein